MQSQPPKPRYNHVKMQTQPAPALMAVQCNQQDALIQMPDAIAGNNKNSRRSPTEFCVGRIQADDGRIRVCKIHKESRIKVDGRIQVDGRIHRPTAG